MPILDNEFTCPKNHSFRANAKLRARCPQCGSMARRDFVATVVKPDPQVKVKEPVKDEKPPVKQAVLIKAGRPRMAVKKSAPKPAVKAKTKAALKSVSKRIAEKKPTKVANGLIKTHRIKTRGTVPAVKRPPSKTAVARHVEGGAPRRYGNYMDEVIDKYGRL